MKNTKSKSGFTLLEILLVIGIIAILAGIVIIAINPAKQLATVRDTQRKTDLKQLSNAMIQFYIDKGFYPASTTLSTTTLTEICNTGSVSATTTSVTGSPCGSLISLSELVPVYLTAIPVDPSGASSTLSFIPTAYANTNGTGYKVGRSVATNQLALQAPLAEINVPLVLGKSPTKTISSFTIPSQVGSTTINEGSHTISITVPYGASLNPLTPTITIVGDSISPLSGVAQNFTSPVTYTVTAIDGTTQTYAVTVSAALNPAKAITNFVLAGATGSINEGAHTIAVTVPYGTNVTTLTPTITITGASVSPTSGTAQNFTNPVTYTVTAADGTTQAYVVTVTPALNPAKAITAFNFTSPAATGVVTEGTHTIAVTVPNGTSLTSLTPTITITGASVSPTSGSAQNFTNPVTYTVTAADGSTQNYTVTVWATIGGLLAHWKMNDNAANTTVVDTTGSYNGTETQRNTSAVSVSGKINNAITFANNEYINAPTISLPGDFTVNMWVKTTTVPASIFTFKGGSYQSGSFDFGWWPSGGGLGMTGYFGGCSYPTNRIPLDMTSVTSTYTDGNWHMITFMLNTTNKTMRGVMDNGTVFDGSTSVPGTGVMCATNGTQIGAASAAFWYFNGGSLDDIRVYNKVLSATELSELYNGGAGTEAE